jgi:hypothetical protein
MTEYISKHEAYTMMKDLEAAYIYPPVKEAYATAARRIDQIRPADVQPVNQWISVKDRLPEVGKSVLVAVVINAKLNLPFSIDFTPEIRIGWLEEIGKWGLQFDSADRDEITHWMPLPKLPKDGDT